MFDKLIDLLIEFIELFKFWVVIDEYEKGIVLQLGKYRRTLNGGNWYFICPFSIDNVLTDNVVLQTLSLGNQSLHDINGEKITLAAFITFKIIDIKTFLLSVESSEDVIASICYGKISNYIQTNDFYEFDFDELENSIKTDLLDYGIELKSLDFSDLITAKTVRLLTDDINLNMAE